MPIRFQKHKFMQSGVIPWYKLLSWLNQSAASFQLKVRYRTSCLGMDESYEYFIVTIPINYCRTGWKARMMALAPIPSFISPLFSMRHSCTEGRQYHINKWNYIKWDNDCWGNNNKNVTRLLTYLCSIDDIRTRSSRNIGILSVLYTKVKQLKE